MKGDQKERTQKGKSTFFHSLTSANPEVRVQPGECSQGQSQVRTQVRAHPGDCSKGQSQVWKQFFALMNLYIEIFKSRTDDTSVSEKIKFHPECILIKSGTSMKLIFFGCTGVFVPT